MYSFDLCLLGRTESCKSSTTAKHGGLLLLRHRENKMDYCCSDTEREQNTCSTFDSLATVTANTASQEARLIKRPKYPN